MAMTRPGIRTHIYSYIKLCVSIVYIYTHIILFVISNVLFVLLLISVDDKIFCVLESLQNCIFPCFPFFLVA